MNKVHLFKNVKFITRVVYPRYYSSGSKVKHYIAHPKYAISLYSNASNCLKYISNYTSVQKKDTTDRHKEKNESEKIQKILEDEEFQSILRDFENDFGVDKETSELLEDIRKNIDCEYEESKTSKEMNNSKHDPTTTTVGGGLDHKYKEFSDYDSTVIPSFEDADEANEQIYHIDQELKPKPFSNLKRGITGVFDIDDIIQVLRNENLADITTISMLTDDKDCSCDFFVLVTARSARHTEAVAETILKLYKKKKNNKDPFVTVQGTDNSGWKVIDMGNIILHIFLEDVRAKYDIESCQLFDLEYDSGGNAEADPMLNVIAEQMEFFNSLKQQSKSSEVPKDIS